MATAEQLEQKLWDKPCPTNRDQMLERNDLVRELRDARRHERHAIERAGYATLMKMRGKVNGLQ